MNTPTKIVLYVVFSLAAFFFGNYFFRDYQRANAAKSPMEELGDPMDVELPDYGAAEPPVESTTSPDPDQPLAPAQANSETEATTEAPESAPPETPVEQASPSEEAAVDDALPPPRLGFYGGGFCIVMLCLGVLAAFDISAFFGRSTIDSLFNDDGVGTLDDEYENAEGEWQRGDYLEAIRLMRDYLAKNPRQIHAALRIAEIYEKDLNNPLAAALEYEEILEEKLPRERWGWAAIHLANLYSGPLEKPDQALALLRRLDSEYGETQAAEKARRRLAMVDGTLPPPEGI